MTLAVAEYPLLDNASATGNPVEWPGGSGVFTVYKGTFGGATVRLVWSPDRGTTWLPVDSSGDVWVTLTEAGGGSFLLPPCFIKAEAIGGTPSGLYAKAIGVNEA